MTVRFRSCVASAVALLALTLQPAQAQTPKLPDNLAAIRAGLEKYQDPVVAVYDGYLSTLGCLEYPAGTGHNHAEYPAGGMGVHFLNPTLTGPVVDPKKPNVLLYEPVGGKLRLVAAEWFVPLATGVKERPTLFGVPFDGPMEGHEPLMPAGLHHYDLHVWLWKENPAGIFKPTNPAIKCQGYPFSFTEAPPKVVSPGR